MNVLVALTANQLIAVLAANPSMRAKFVAAIFASLIVRLLRGRRPDCHNDTEAIAQLRTGQVTGGSRRGWLFPKINYGFGCDSATQACLIAIRLSGKTQIDWSALRSRSFSSFIYLCINNAMLSAKKREGQIEGCSPAVSPATFGFHRSNG
jgi:hypothetical protein